MLAQLSKPGIIPKITEARERPNQGSAGPDNSDKDLKMTKKAVPYNSGRMGKMMIFLVNFA
jgi:hypothetical protein